MGGWWNINVKKQFVDFAFKEEETVSGWDHEKWKSVHSLELREEMEIERKKCETQQQKSEKGD